LTLNLRSCRYLLLLTPFFVQAAPILVTGTPGNALEGTPASPGLTAVFTFSTLTPGVTFTTSSPYSSDGVTISSPDGLTVLPFSEQTNPNYLADDSTDGTADILITTPGGVTAIGVGIADSDEVETPSGAFVPVTIELQPLNSTGGDLGSAFDVTIPETNPDTAGNGYYVVEDTTPDIYGLEILQPTSLPAGTFSGLAIAPVEVTPEPVTLPLLTGGIFAIAGIRRLRKRAKA
jgi:hypothetical protein